jgi:hypothetical protein
LQRGRFKSQGVSAMSEKDLLLSINPFHLELIRPLVKWKILSIKELYEDSGYVGTYKNFHKIISRLEKAEVINGNKDVWTKTKRMHLTRLGNELVNNSRWMSHVINSGSFFHDSRVTLYLRYLASHLKISSVELEQERMKIRSFQDMQRIRPDAEFSITTSSEKHQRFLLEVELTQKTKDRLIEKFEWYHQIPDYNFILFVFPTHSLANSYLQLFKSLTSSHNKSNYIFAMEPGLIKGNFSLTNTKAYFRGEELSLENVFKDIHGISGSDPAKTIKGLWRQSFESLF